jgi:hypothetical protein
MTLDEFTERLDRLLAGGKGDADIVQLSGGEPKVHPDLERMDLFSNRVARFVWSVLPSRRRKAEANWRSR